MARTLILLGTMVFLLLTYVATPALSQIHFSPTWGTGKRSETSSLRAGKDTCWAQSDFRVMFHLVQVIQDEARRYSECVQSMFKEPEFKDE